MHKLTETRKQISLEVLEVTGDTSWLPHPRSSFKCPLHPLASQVVLVVKNLAVNAGDVGLIPGSGRSPGEGHSNPLQHPCLENPTDRGARWATVHRVAESDTTEVNLATPTTPITISLAGPVLQHYQSGALCQLVWELRTGTELPGCELQAWDCIRVASVKISRFRTLPESPLLGSCLHACILRSLQSCPTLWPHRL